MKTLKALVCDLDGTLIDTAPGIADTLNDFLAEHGRGGLAPATVKGFIGDGAARLVQRAFAATGESVDGPALDALAAAYSARLAARPPGPADVFPGVAETLARLAGDGLGLAVCSNKPQAAVATALSSAGLAQHFQVLIGGDSLAERKPSAAPLLAAVAGLGVPPGAAAMVGDNEVDVATARAAGIAVVAVTYGYARVPMVDLGADLLIDGFAALPDALERLESRGHGR